MKKWAWVALVTLVADQAVKAWVAAVQPHMTLIPGVLRITYAENTGMAFSLFSGRPWLLGLVSAVCILAGWRVLRRYRLGTASRIAAMLMLGGAVGNMMDRFLRGYVVDMFEVLFMRFAVFNVADAALCVGAALLAATLLFCTDDWREKSWKQMN